MSYYNKNVVEVYFSTFNVVTKSSGMHGGIILFAVQVASYLAAHDNHSG